MPCYASCLGASRHAPFFLVRPLIWCVMFVQQAAGAKTVYGMHKKWGMVVLHAHDPVRQTRTYSFYEESDVKPAEPASNFREPTAKEIAMRALEAKEAAVDRVNAATAAALDMQQADRSQTSAPAADVGAATAAEAKQTSAPLRVAPIKPGPFVLEPLSSSSSSEDEDMEGRKRSLRLKQVSRTLVAQQIQAGVYDATCGECRQETTHQVDLEQFGQVFCTDCLEVIRVGGSSYICYTCNARRCPLCVIAWPEVYCA